MSKLKQIKGIIDGARGIRSLAIQSLLGCGSKALSRWAISCNFFEKIAILMPFGSHFAYFQSHLKKAKFLRFKSQLKKFFPLLQVKSKTRLKSCILG